MEDLQESSIVSAAVVNVHNAERLEDLPESVVCPPPVVRLAVLEPHSVRGQNERALGREDAVSFSDRPVWLGIVLEDLRTEDDIKARVAERQLLSRG